LEQIVFKDWFAQELNRRGMTGGEFAERAKVARSGIYFYLNGSRLPDPSALVRIASGLGIKAEDIPPFERRKTGRPSKIRT
jgi:transcriptional regulator with XRE-family HTH domain